MPARDKAVTIINHDAQAIKPVPWWGIAYALAVWCLLAACILLAMVRIIGRVLVF